MNTTEQSELEVVQPTALEAISRAEIDVAIATARRFPHHQPHQLSVVKQRMMSFATLDEDTAASCFYTLPRGGKNIQGPSVRLAEIAVSCFGNLRAGSRIIHTSTDGANPHVVVQSVVMDLEANVSVSIEKRRRIVGKKSKGGVIDEDDINLAANACAAIAFRDATFKVVPLALVKPVFEAARKVAVGDAKTLSDRRAKCIEAFAKMGVTRDRVLAKLGKKSLDDIDLADLETLIGLFNAIREDSLSIDEAFTVETKPDLSDLNTRLKQKAAATAAPAPAPAPTPAPFVEIAPTATQQPPQATVASNSTSAPASHYMTREEIERAEAEPPVICRYCHTPVADVSAHSCPGMVEASEAAAKPPNPADEAKQAHDAVIHLLGINEVAPEQCLAYCRANKFATDKHTRLSDLSTLKLLRIAKVLEGNPQAVEAMKGTPATAA